MSQKSRIQLKNIFTSGNIPNQQDFADFIDSTWNITDDGSISGSGSTGPAGPTGPFLGGNFGELYCNSSTGSFSETVFSGSNWNWSTGVVGETEGTVATAGVYGVTPASFTISNTGIYNISVSANLITTISLPGLYSEPINMEVMLNSSAVPKLSFGLTYQNSSWSGFYSLTNGDTLSLRLINSSAGTALIQTGSLFFTVTQIK